MNAKRCQHCDISHTIVSRAKFSCPLDHSMALLRQCRTTYNFLANYFVLLVYFGSYASFNSVLFTLMQTVPWSWNVCNAHHIKSHHFRENKKSLLCRRSSSTPPNCFLNSVAMPLPMCRSRLTQCTRLSELVNKSPWTSVIDIIWINRQPQWDARLQDALSEVWIHTIK